MFRLVNATNDDSKVRGVISRIGDTPEGVLSSFWRSASTKCLSCKMGKEVRSSS